MKMRGKPRPVKMNLDDQLEFRLKFKSFFEKVKCHNLTLFRERKRMNDQMQPIREKIISILHRNDVKRASFFGSIVRGEMTEESDVDLLVEFVGKKSLLDIAHLKNELEDAINRRVDVLTYKSLHPYLKERILAEQVPIL
jgi:predicted nucleotidyltransferase